MDDAQSPLPPPSSTPPAPGSSSEKKRRRIEDEDDSSGSHNNAVQPTPPSVKRRSPPRQPLSLAPRERMQGASTQHVPLTGEEKEAEEQRQLAEASPSMLDDDFVEEGNGEDEDEGNDVEEAMEDEESEQGNEDMEEDDDEDSEIILNPYVDDEAGLSGEASGDEGEEGDDEGPNSLEGEFIVDSDQEDSVSEGSSAPCVASFDSEVARERARDEEYVAELEKRNRRGGYADENSEDDETQGYHSERALAISRAIVHTDRGIRRRLRHEAARLRDAAEAEAQAEQERLDEDVQEGQTEEGPFDGLAGGFAPAIAYGFTNDARKRNEVLEVASRKAWGKKAAEQRAARGEGGGVEETKDNGGPGDEEDEGEVAFEYRLNPSSIAEYFSSHQCPRYLVLDSLRDDCSPATFRAASGGLITQKRDCDGGFRAVQYLGCQLGNQYEAEVLQKLRDRHGFNVQQCGSASEDDAAAEGARAVDVLRAYAIMCGDVANENMVRFLYQASLSVQDLGLPPTERASIHGPTEFRPDLIEVSFRRRERLPGAVEEGDKPLCVHLKVIEIKAAERILPKHRVQLGLYVLMLQRWLAQEGNVPVEHRALYHVNTTTAGVWLLDAEWHEPTDISSQSDDLAHFLRTDLVDVLQRPEEARSCGNCRVCKRLAQAMRAKHGGEEGCLFGPGGTQAAPEDVVFSGMMNSYEMGLVHELSANVWPTAEVTLPRTLRALVDTLPRACTLYVAGPFNNPRSTQWEVQGLEVEGDPGWDFQVLVFPHVDNQAALRDEVLRRQAPRTAFAICRDEHVGSLAYIMDFEGKWMAHTVVHQDFRLRTIDWQVDKLEKRPFRVDAVDAEARTCVLLEENREENGDEHSERPLTNAGSFVLLRLGEGGARALGTVLKKDKVAKTLSVSWPAVFGALPAEGDPVCVSLTLPVNLELQVRSLASTVLERPLHDQDRYLYVAVPLPGLKEEQGGVLEVLHGVAEERTVVPYVSWSKEDRSFLLAEPFAVAEGGDLPTGTLVKVQEPDQWGRCVDREVSGILHLRRTPNDLLYAYVLLADSMPGDIWPFSTRKVTLRRHSCRFAAEELFAAFSRAPAMCVDPAHAAATRAAADRVKAHTDANAAAFWQAALLRSKLHSMIDGELRLLNGADTFFPHVRPDVEILLTGVANRFLALPQENHFVCVSVDVHLQCYVDDEPVEETRRYSSLDNKEWDGLGHHLGHYADCFLIVVLYRVLKSIERLNAAAGQDWTRQLSLQVYTYDDEFAKAVCGMLSKVFCSEGGLAGPRDGAAEGERGPVPPSLWDMAQYLCLVLNPASMGILSNRLLQPPSNAGHVDEAQEEPAGGAHGRGSFAFCRTVPMVSLVPIIRKAFAFTSTGEEPYSMEAVMHALRQTAAVKVDEPEDNREDNRLARERLLEERVLWGHWKPADRRRPTPSTATFDKSCIRPRERVTWRIIGMLRQALHFLQDGVALNYAPKFPSACLLLRDPTLARLAFMAQNEVAMAVEDGLSDRRVTPTERLAQEMGAQLRLVCCFKPEYVAFSRLSPREQRTLLETYFGPGKLQALLAHLFPGRPRAPDMTVRRMVDFIVEHYNDADRAHPIETFIWTHRNKDTPYMDLTEAVCKHYLLEVVGGKRASALWGEDSILVEASANGRQTMTTFKDDVMQRYKRVASSISPAGTFLAHRRYAWCKPCRVPGPMAALLDRLDKDVHAYVCVKETKAEFITQDSVPKAYLAEALAALGLGRLAQEGSSLLRDRASFLEIDGMAIRRDPDGARDALQDCLNASHAHYLVFNNVPGYTLHHQLDHVEELAASGEEAMLIQMMRDPIEYNARVHDVLPQLALDEEDPHWERLTERQHAAALKIRDRACTIVRGPPGTGKTEFIASLILSIEPPPRGEVPIVVGITASQRSGIGTLINRIAREKGDRNDLILVAVGSGGETWESWDLHPEVHRFKRSELKSSAEFKTLVSQKGKVLVLAGTPWQLKHLPSVLDQKAKEATKKLPEQPARLFALDVLVADEASQMPVTAASCVVQLLRRPGRATHGRAVFVGDEYQLPPVMKGNYTERPLAHQRFYTDFAPRLRSCADSPVPAYSLCKGASSFNRGMVLELWAPWDAGSGERGPHAKLLHAGNGPHAALLTPYENHDFKSFSHLVQVVFDTEEGDEHMLPAMHTAAAARHFFVVDMDVLPIERSVFECLQMSNERARRLRGRKVDDTILVQLEDTFRMNQLLATAFHHVYQAEGPSPATVDLRFNAVPKAKHGNKEGVVQVDMLRVRAFLRAMGLVDHPELLGKLLTIVEPSSCLVTVELQGLSEGALMSPHPKGPESVLAALLVHALKEGWPPDVPEAEFMSQHCFINTPTNKQRRAVLQTLQSKVAANAGTWNVATVDKMQGQEADCVLSLYAYPDATIVRQPGFIYSRNRINVALSRAKCKAILVLSDQMLKMRPSILAGDPNIEAGYAMFRHIQRMCVEGRRVDAAAGHGQPLQRAVKVVLTSAEMGVLMEQYGAFGEGEAMDV